MPDWISIHEPVLVNTIGHCAGTVIFGILLYLLLVNWRRAREERSSLPPTAAALAMLWNLGSLVALASGPAAGFAANVIVAASFSALSLLPAVLLHISLASRPRPLWMCGYALSLAAVALHSSELWTQAPRFHDAALLLVIVGFGGLTVISVVLEVRRENRAAGSRLAAAMGLFLFAISFAHFGSQHPQYPWSGEFALHHAGLPLALLVLLQDYRFLLLDVFLRFIVSASLAAAAVLTAFRVAQAPGLARHLQHPFDTGLLFVSACLVLTLFVYARNRVQRLLTRVLFLRANMDEVLAEVRRLARTAASEDEFLRHAAEAVARFVRAARFSLTKAAPLKTDVPATPAAVLDPANWNVPSWVQAVVPLHFSRGDTQYLLLGSREGGRRYLSEDFTVLARLKTAIVEQVEQLRGLQMQHLVSQAELRALQAQINPHFFFNALNTLYGTIDRGNSEARRLVLNLSEVFRYLLRSDRTFIEIAEELRIIRAYLEIEELRLGSKLHTEVEVDGDALHAMIPLLSIQPLVENAVKHGVASRSVEGFVRLNIRTESSSVAVSVANSGECDRGLLTDPRGGIGLANVRRRLALCYGEQAGVQVEVGGGMTTVGFVLPLKHAVEAAAV